MLKLVKLKFGTVHFGQGGLDQSAGTLAADSLFAALCLEALKTKGPGGLTELHERVSQGKLLFSDTFPYLTMRSGGTSGQAGLSTEYFLPKPVIEIPDALEDTSPRQGSALKKQVKQISFIPCSQWEEWLSGRTGADGLSLIADLNDRLGTAWTAGRTSTQTDDENSSSSYQVGLYSFRSAAFIDSDRPDIQESGLWLLAYGTEPADLDLLLDLLRPLQTAGLGGKRTSGYGAFTLEEVPTADMPELLQAVQTADNISGHEIIPATISTRTDQACQTAPSPTGGQSLPVAQGPDRPSPHRYMTLTAAIPAATDHFGQSALEESTYLLVRRSGFVSSQSFSDSPIRKRDSFKFAAGSVFPRPFAGEIADVSPDWGRSGGHPVYSYSKPLWMRLR